MRRIRTALDRHRPAFAVAALLLAAALLPRGPLGARAVLAGLWTPLGVLLEGAGSPSTAGGDGADEARRLREEVAWLQARVRTLEAENASLREFGSLRLQERARDLLAVAASAAGRDAAWPLRRSVALDRGTGDGIRRGLPVIAGRCLAGFVVEAGPRSSRVQLLDDPAPRADDPKVRAAVRVFRPGAADPGVEGVLSGGRPGLLRVRMLPAGVVAEGDLVVTSGTDPEVPEGLLVGRVVSVEEDGAPELAAARVVPAADLGGLREVFVLVTPEPDAGASRGGLR